MVMSEKKKFKDSALFGVIKSVAPQVLDGATDLVATAFPALAPLNNLVDKAIGIAKEKGDHAAVAQLTESKEDYLKEMDMILEDKQSAREMYQNTDHNMADSIANKIINWNLWIMLILVAVQVLVIMYVDGQVAAVVTGIVGTITGALINERNTVVNFFYGSSKGSKDKDFK